MLYFVELETFFVTRVKTGVTIVKNRCVPQSSADKAGG